MTKLSWLPVHPFLAAAYPVLALLNSNTGQVKPSIVVRPLIGSLLATAILLLILRLLVQEWSSAAMLTTWLVVLFYSYGHAYNALAEAELFGVTVGRHRILTPLWTALAAAGAYVFMRGPDLRQVGMGMNLALAAALVFPLWGVVHFQAGQRLAANDWVSSGKASLATSQYLESEMPDIYYIILDAYARQDTLVHVFDYDNSEFLGWLESRGFFVAYCSQSNYAQSELSLTSSLNYRYLEDLIEGDLRDEEDRSRLWPYLRQPQIRRMLEGYGYEVIAFETGYYWSEWEDADLYLRPGSAAFRGLTAFEGTLLRSTAAWAAIDLLPVLPDFLSRDIDRSADMHRQRIRFVLDSLRDLPGREGPQFVFAHIVSPHRPFVYDASGAARSDDYRWDHEEIGLGRYAEGYREQLSFLNQELMAILSDIIEHSEAGPVIILQSDHGPEEGSSSDRMRILNAYYLPEEGEDQVYSAITPVNSFRVVLSELFALDYEILPDKSLFSTYQDPFDYRLIESSCDLEGQSNR